MVGVRWAASASIGSREDRLGRPQACPACRVTSAASAVAHGEPLIRAMPSPSTRPPASHQPSHASGAGRPSAAPPVQGNVERLPCQEHDRWHGRPIGGVLWGRLGPPPGDCPLGKGGAVDCRPPLPWPVVQPILTGVESSSLSAGSASRWPAMPASALKVIFPMALSSLVMV